MLLDIIRFLTVIIILGTCVISLIPIVVIARVFFDKQYHNLLNEQ